MKIASLKKDIELKEDRPAINVMLETEAGKEIRIAFKAGQLMKRHQAPFPIVVEVFEGSIEFGVNDDKVVTLEAGDLIALEASVPHDLLANTDSIVRLSLNKLDTTKRVEDVVK